MPLCLVNNNVVSGLVSPSATLFVVDIMVSIIRSISHHNKSTTFLIFICLVRVVGFWVRTISIAAALSSYITVESFCSIFNSYMMDLMYDYLYTVIGYCQFSFYRAVWYCLLWFCLYAIDAPASIISIPIIDLRVFISPAQSESTYAYGSTHDSWYISGTV